MIRGNPVLKNYSFVVIRRKRYFIHSFGKNFMFITPDNIHFSQLGFFTK